MANPPRGWPNANVLCDDIVGGVHRADLAAHLGGTLRARAHARIFPSDPLDTARARFRGVRARARFLTLVDTCPQGRLDAAFDGS